MRQSFYRPATIPCNGSHRQRRPCNIGSFPWTARFGFGYIRRVFYIRIASCRSAISKGGEFGIELQGSQIPVQRTALHQLTMLSLVNNASLVQDYDQVCSDYS